MRLLAVVLLGAGAVAMAQTAPALHSRTSEAQPAPTKTDAIDYEKGFSTLPDEASGEYELDENGSVVQITIDQGRLSGYVTKMEQGAALTLFFLRTSIQGDKVSFTTKTVHGMSYSFAGSVIRGDNASASETGYFRLAGNWTEYRNGGHETEWVSLRSTPRVMTGDNN
jgi:hypothetical protein